MSQGQHLNGNDSGGGGGGGADQVLMTNVYPYDIAAHDYGGRVPVDTAPDPVPVYRALKITPSAHHRHELINLATSQQLWSEPHGICRCTTTGMCTTVSTQKDELQLWELNCLLHV